MKYHAIPIQDPRSENPFERARSAAPPAFRKGTSAHQRASAEACPAEDETEIAASFGPHHLLGQSEEIQKFRQEASLALEAPRPAPSQKIPGRILLADDDILVRGSLVAVLESEGYLVDEAGDGREAVALAIKHKPDLVLLDLNMPHWDGWTAFSRLDRVTPLLPVIVITARPNQYPKAVNLGVDAFMEKPLNIPVLMQAIKQLTTEDKRRHLRRITCRTFVTRLLGGSESQA